MNDDCTDFNETERMDKKNWSKLDQGIRMREEGKLALQNLGWLFRTANGVFERNELHFQKQ